MASPRYVRSISEAREAKERQIVEDILHCSGGDQASERTKAWARAHAPVAFQIPARVEDFFEKYDRLLDSVERMQEARGARQQRIEDQLVVGGPIHRPKYNYRALIKPNTPVAAHYTLASKSKSRSAVKARMIRTDRVVQASNVVPSQTVSNK